MAQVPAMSAHEKATVKSGSKLEPSQPSDRAEIDRPTENRAETAPEDQKCTIQNEGATWKIDYFGEETNVPNSIGMGYLALLVSTPEVAWFPLELQAGQRTTDVGVDRALAEGLQVTTQTQRAIESLTPSAVRAALAEEKRLEKQIETSLDQVEINEAEGELAKHRASFKAELGMQGRVRLKGSAEKARLAVRGNFDRTLKAIERENQIIGRAIRDRVSLKTPLSFIPQRGENWKVGSKKKIKTLRLK
jgi:hypothetical protein